MIVDGAGFWFAGALISFFLECPVVHCKVRRIPSWEASLHRFSCCCCTSAEGLAPSFAYHVKTCFLRRFRAQLRFVWGMLILTEFRTIYNHLFVLYYMPSTDDDNKLFVQSEDGKAMQIVAVPRSHKYFVLYVVILSRFLIALVVFYVGTNFLTASASLLESGLVVLHFPRFPAACYLEPCPETNRP